VGRKVVTIAALIGFLTLPVCAQSRGGSGAHFSGTRSSVSPRPVRNTPVVVRPSSSSSSTSRSANSAVVNSAFANGSVQDLFGFPVPGLGFDYTHLAAVNGNLGVMALIDPVTQGEIALALRLRGVNAGVSPLFYSGYGYGGAPIVMGTPMAAPVEDAPAPQQQQAPIVVVVPAAAQQAAAVMAAEQTPLPDPGEFVLVQRDGRLLFAVAFTAEPGRVVYVTKEGLRRSIALDQLDVDTTMRMNEERGSSIQIPRA
jgi:hypothetical protein